MADEEANKVEQAARKVEEVVDKVVEELTSKADEPEETDSVRYLVQIIKDVGVKSEKEAPEDGKETGKSDEKVEAAPTETVPEPHVEEAATPVLISEAPKEPAPASEEASAAEQQAPLTREAPRDETAEPASALDFDASNKALFEAPKPEEQPASPEEAPVKEEAVHQHTRELSKEESPAPQEAAPQLTRELPKDAPQEAAPQLTRELPKEESHAPQEAAPTEPESQEPAPSSISYLVKIYKEANGLAETNKEKEKEQLGVAIEEISKAELSKLSLKPDDLSIKISEVDEDKSSFPKDANDSTTYLVQIIKDVISQAPAKVEPVPAATPAILEAIKIETAAFVATRDLPKEEGEEPAKVIETAVEHTVTVTTTKEAPPPAEQPAEQPASVEQSAIKIQEVAKEEVDFQVDEDSSVTYLVQIVNDILSQPPRYPHETDTSISTQPPTLAAPEDLKVDSVKQVAEPSSGAVEEEPLHDLTTSQISEGVDSLINELTNQVLRDDLEHELTSNALVSSEDNYDYNADAELALSRPFPKEATVNEIAHEIVISAVSGAQNKLDDASSYTSPSTNEFNKLGTVEYITRDQPLEIEPVELPTFTRDQQQWNVSKPTALKDGYQIILNPPIMKEPEIHVDAGYNLGAPNVSLSRPAAHEAHISLPKEADVTSSNFKPSWGAPKEFSITLHKPAPVDVPPFSLNDSYSTSSTNYSVNAELPTRDIPKISCSIGPSKASELLVGSAGFSKPHFTPDIDSEQLASSERKIDPYEIIKAYSTTSTAELLRNFNEEIPGAKICRIVGDRGAESQFGVGFQANPTGPFSISSVQEKARKAGVREGDLIIAVNDVYVVGVREPELVVQFLEAKKSNELNLELVAPDQCPVDVRSVISL